jgi:hypothetical protein
VGTSTLVANPTIGPALQGVCVARTNEVFSITEEEGNMANVRTARQVKSQQRRDRWRTTMQNAELKQKYRSFLRGYDNFRESCQVNHLVIETAMNSHFRDVDDNTYRDNNSSVEDTQLSHARDMGVCEMQCTLELLQD